MSAYLEEVKKLYDVAEKILLCKECKHHVATTWGNGTPKDAGYHECSNIRFQKMDLVMGGMMTRYCHDMRDSQSRCGIEGRWFEAKE